MTVPVEAVAKPASRAIVIGPVLPFRGGIAQHTTLLARALSVFNSCRVFPFRRLYPQWLYPGQSDRDPNYEGHQELRAAYSLDSLNPLTWRRAVEEARLKRLLPSARVAVHPHPVYDQFPEPKPQLPRRAGLELLFYGFVRPYKGLDTLVDAMGLLSGEDVFLTVVGEFWGAEGHFRDRIGALSIENQIEIRQRYQSNEETAELFQRADVVVLPYRSATASGVVPIAYHYHRPVIVTAGGGLPDVVIEGETGHIVAADDANVLAAAIRSLNQVECKTMQPNIERFKQRLSWASLANAVCGQTGCSEERLGGRKTAQSGSFRGEEWG
jgi:glycosyltransferase involved in cell wall biosynthesis